MGSPFPGKNRQYPWESPHGSTSCGLGGVCRAERRHSALWAVSRRLWHVPAEDGQTGQVRAGRRRIRDRPGARSQSALARRRRSAGVGDAAAATLARGETLERRRRQCDRGARPCTAIVQRRDRLAPSRCAPGLAAWAPCARQPVESAGCARAPFIGLSNRAGMLPAEARPVVAPRRGAVQGAADGIDRG